MLQQLRTQKSMLPATSHKRALTKEQTALIYVCTINNGPGRKNGHIWTVISHSQSATGETPNSQSSHTPGWFVPHQCSCFGKDQPDNELQSLSTQQI